MVTRTVAGLTLAGALLLGAATFTWAQQRSDTGQAACPHETAMAYHGSMMNGMGSRDHTSMPAGAMGHAAMPHAMAPGGDGAAMTPGMAASHAGCPHAPQ